MTDTQTTNFSVADVLDAIIEAKGAQSEYGIDWQEWSTYNPSGTTYAEKFPPLQLGLAGGLFDVKLIEETGGMDEGSSAGIILGIGSQFFKKHGYYASHYGYDWDGDFCEVTPAEKTITVYERV